MEKEHIGKRRELPIHEDALVLNPDNLWVFPDLKTHKLFNPSQFMRIPTETKPIKIVAPNEYEFNIDLNDPYEIEASRKLTIEELLDLICNNLDYN